MGEGHGTRWLLAGSVLAGALGALVIGTVLLIGSTSTDPLAPAGADADAAEAPSSLGGTPAPGLTGAGDAALEEDRTGASDPLAGADPEWIVRVAERTGIGERALQAYATAAQRLAREQPGCGIGWNTLAGIGFVESEHGTIDGSRVSRSGRVSPPIVEIPLDGTTTDAIPDTDGGSLDYDTVWDRAVGPMQFIPSTWRAWASDGNGDGIEDPQNIDDAAYAAARYLCVTGGDLTTSEGWIAAVAAYNDTIDYNHRVAEAADLYAHLAG